MQTIVSMDLETRGQNPATCAIASIGVVIAIPNKGIVAEAEWWIDPKDALLHGAEDESTMQWWAKQSPEAQRQLHEGTYTVKEALAELVAFLFARFEDYTTLNKAVIVARSPSFDCAILMRHYEEVCGFQTPWKYWQERDHRTFEQAYRDICSAAGINYPSYKHAYPVAHNALSDARNQALYLLHIQQMAAMTTRK